MSSGPKTRVALGPTSPRGQRQAAAEQAAKDREMTKKMQDAYERFGRSSESDSPGYKKGGKIKKYAKGGMPAKRSAGSGSMRPMPKPYEQQFRDKIATPVIPDQAKYPEYIAEVGEERVSGPRMRKGGMASSSASKRADGIAQRGKTRGKMV